MYIPVAKAVLSFLYISRLSLLLLLFGVTGAAATEIAGTVVFAAGEARIGDHPAAEGKTVGAGDRLQTGRDGYLYIKTVDDGFLILRPDSLATIAAYQTDPANPGNNQIKIELHSGVARSVSGEGVKQARDRFRFNTPVAAIGVRGTDFTVFTDELTTRVAVLSGGVVVSGFGNGCAREGVGPCEGASSLELFADRDAVLQVEQGQTMPRVLQGRRLSPDAVTPPRENEPGVESAPESATSAAPGDLDGVSLDPIKTAQVIDLPDSVITPVVDRSPNIRWGRWQALADGPVEIDLDERAGYELIGLAGPFTLLRQREPSLVMPADGSVGFALRDSQAVVTWRGGAHSAASVENGTLDVDFGTGRFKTQIDLVAGSTRLTRRAAGSVAANGMFANGSQTGDSNMIVNGVLDGAGTAMSAAYLFQTRIDAQRTAEGITVWGR